MIIFSNEDKLRNKIGDKFLLNSIIIYIKKKIVECFSFDLIIDNFKSLIKQKNYIHYKVFQPFSLKLFYHIMLSFLAPKIFFQAPGGIGYPGEVRTKSHRIQFL